MYHPVSSSIFSERGKNSSDFTGDGLIEMRSRIPRHARTTSVIETLQQGREWCLLLPKGEWMSGILSQKVMYNLESLTLTTASKLATWTARRLMNLPDVSASALSVWPCIEIKREELCQHLDKKRTRSHHNTLEHTVGKFSICLFNIRSNVPSRLSGNYSKNRRVRAVR